MEQETLHTFGDRVDSANNSHELNLLILAVENMDTMENPFCRITDTQNIHSEYELWFTDDRYNGLGTRVGETLHAHNFAIKGWASYQNSFPNIRRVFVEYVGE